MVLVMIWSQDLKMVNAIFSYSMKATLLFNFLKVSIKTRFHCDFFQLILLEYYSFNPFIYLYCKLCIIRCCWRVFSQLSLLTRK